jgi:hypothetical protein
VRAGLDKHRLLAASCLVDRRAGVRARLVAGRPRPLTSSVYATLSVILFRPQPLRLRPARRGRIYRDLARLTTDLHGRWVDPATSRGWER